MTPQTIDNYRLTSMVEPSDEVLGKVTRNQILLVNGNPFCKDDRHRCQPKAPTTIRGGIHALYADYLHLIYSNKETQTLEIRNLSSSELEMSDRYGYTFHFTK